MIDVCTGTCMEVHLGRSPIKLQWRLIGDLGARALHCRALEGSRAVHVEG